jgi:hypothetical protein
VGETDVANVCGAECEREGEGRGFEVRRGGEVAAGAAK